MRHEYLPIFYRKFGMNKIRLGRRIGGSRLRWPALGIPSVSSARSHPRRTTARHLIERMRTSYIHVVLQYKEFNCSGMVNRSCSVEQNGP